MTPQEQNRPDAADPSPPEIADPILIEEPRDEAPAPETPAQATKPVSNRKRPGNGFILLLFGGVCAAALGAVATVYVLPMLPAAWQPATAELRSLAAGQSEQINALSAEIAALSAEIPPAPDFGPIEAALSDMQERIAALEARPAAAAPDTTPAIAAIQADLEQLRAQLAQGADAPQISAAEIAAAAAAASARIAAAEAEAADVRAKAEAEASRVLAQAAIGQLRAALETGAPMADALAQLQAAGIAAPDALSADVPTLAELRAAFVPAARAALAAARKEAAGESTLDQLTSFLMAQTGARSLEPREGADPDAVLSRAEAALNSDELAAALSETASLPATSQAELAAWQALAERRLAATQALATLAGNLN